MEEIKPTLSEPKPELEHPVETPHAALNLMKKVVLGFVAFFALAGLVYGGYTLGQRNAPPIPALSPTPSLKTTAEPTANWKTYTDPKQYYSIRYPENWNVFPNIIGGTLEGYDGTVINSAKQLEPYGEMLAESEQAGILINVIGLDKSPNETLAEYFKRKMSSLKSIENTTSVMIGSYAALKYPNDRPVLTSYLVSNENMVYSISIQIQNASLSSTVDQILSTFKFSDTEPTTVQSSKTYQDGHYGYTITYPSDWKLQQTYADWIKKQGETNILSGIQLDKVSKNHTIIIDVIDKKDTTSLVDWWNKYSSERGTTGTLAQTNSTFNSYPSIKTSFTTGNNPARTTEHSYFLLDPYVYFISVEYPVGDSNTELLNIVGTFKP